MPPKKRTACNLRKQRLTFLESPQEGPVHEYGAVPPKAETKCVPTKSLDRDASTPWVTSQFDQAVASDFPIRQHRRGISNNSSIRSRDVNHSQLRKQSVCKFPSLAFKAAEIVETAPFCPSRRPMTVSVPAPPSPPSPEGPPCSDIPDIHTPEADPKEIPRLSASRVVGWTPSSRRWVEPCEAPDALPADGPILAEDTPEREYGVRLTWRRRQGLMKYLKSRGRLQSSQILVQR
ncbi:RAD9, HUS1, RAD1-interacting nuclear orphan protein 1 [Eleutherodactylus coqui]|uniref:RAD9, HUS1, RAD1-interacting nuclear orphan protein 1 n=1 Tax=Eleutherodactylus coqui TaxID=57060 RepID=A0A8J6EM19_ELECQ|nr:hypothetical protein GDO78_015134 [Eleutherodactylus coqui]